MSKAPITLAIDTAQACCQCALIDGDGNIYSATEARARGHAEYIMDQIDLVLDNAQFEYEELERVVVTSGPGSFTGLRVGLAAARGIAVALDIPCLGVPTMFALSLSGEADQAVSVIIDARRDQHYRQDFAAPGFPSSTPQALDNAVVLEGLSNEDSILGSGSEWAAQSVGATDLELQRPEDERSFVDIVSLAFFGQSAPAEDYPPEPCYIRAADAKPQSAKHIERI